MTEYATTKQRLINELLASRGSGTLAEFLAERLAAGASYERISKDVWTLTGEDISYGTVRNWCADITAA